MGLDAFMRGFRLNLFMSLFDHVDGNSRRYLQRLKDEGVVGGEGFIRMTRRRLEDGGYFL